MGTLEGVRVPGTLASSDAFSGKESDIAEGQREGGRSRGKTARSGSHLTPSRGYLPTLLLIPSSSPSAALGTRKE